MWRTSVAGATYLTMYLTAIAWFLFIVVMTPATALAVQYSRIISAAAQSSTIAARSGSIASSIGSAIAASGPGSSVAVRGIAAVGGWPAIGVVGGMILWQTYYDSTRVQEIKDATETPASDMTIPGATGMEGQTMELHDPCVGSCSGRDQSIDWRKVPPGFGGCTSTPVVLPSGWTAWGGHPAGDGSCRAYHTTGQPNKGNPPMAAVPADGPAIADYIGELPSEDGHSIPSNSSPVGSTNTADSATTVINDPIAFEDTTTTTVPSTAIPDGASVVKTNVTPDPGTVSETTQTTEETKTTTTTTNEDDSVTEQTETEVNMSCTAGNHDQRTMGSILQEHQNTWSSVGLLGSLNNLEAIVWPDTLPTISIGGGMFGTHEIDFENWSSTFANVRSIVVPIASIHGLYIIFRGRA